MTKTQERKQFITDLFEAIDEVMPYISVVVMQRKPYTAVEVSYEREYDSTVIGLGFSKVCWPDKWDVEKGIRIATGKALSHIWQQMDEDKDGNNT